MTCVINLIIQRYDSPRDLGPKGLPFQCKVLNICMHVPGKSVHSSHAFLKGGYDPSPKMGTPSKEPHWIANSLRVKQGRCGEGLMSVPVWHSRLNTKSFLSLLYLAFQDRKCYQWPKQASLEASWIQNSPEPLSHPPAMHHHKIY